MNGLIDTAVSCDGTWQKRGHQSLFGVQTVISVGTRKVLRNPEQALSCLPISWAVGQYDICLWGVNGCSSTSLSDQLPCIIEQHGGCRGKGDVEPVSGQA